MRELLRVELEGRTEDDAAWLILAEEPIARTVEIGGEGSGVLVDYAANGAIVDIDMTWQDEQCRAIVENFARESEISLTRYYEALTSQAA